MLLILLLPFRLFNSSSFPFFSQGIETQEEMMTSILGNIRSMLPGVYEKAKFNGKDLLAVLQGLVGFTSAIVNENPLEFINAALGVADALSDKLCLTTLDLSGIEKWLNFGDKYKPLIDSSEFDYDKVDVSAVPEIMQVPFLFYLYVFSG